VRTPSLSPGGILLADLNRELRHRSRGPVLSVAVHAAILLVLAIEVHRAPRIAPFRLPGTAHGITLLTYYSPGSTRPSATDSPVHEKRTKTTPVHKRLVAETPTPPAPPRADAGSGNTSESGLGEGDIRVALQQHFPYPRPDLSVLAHGTKGDVILDAVIDEHGRITQLTLIQGLAPAIDEAVIATVKQWLFAPATRDGVPVASEQEFRFHYERG
jgi:periplasmic protein TonB